MLISIIPKLIDCLLSIHKTIMKPTSVHQIPETMDAASNLIMYMYVYVSSL